MAGCPFFYMRLAMAEAEQLQLFHRGFWGQRRAAQLDSRPIQAGATRISRTRRIPGVRWTVEARGELVELVPSNQ